MIQRLLLRCVRASVSYTCNVTYFWHESHMRPIYIRTPSPPPPSPWPRPLICTEIALPDETRLNFAPCNCSTSINKTALNNYKVRPKTLHSIRFARFWSARQVTSTRSSDGQPKRRKRNEDRATQAKRNKRKWLSIVKLFTLVVQRCKH